MRHIDALDLLRARTVILGIAVLALFLTLGTLPAEPTGRETIVFSLAMYAAVGITLYVVGRGAGLDWPRVIGPPPAPSDRPLLGLAVPLLAISLASIWLLYLPLSWIAPDFVRRVVLEEGTDLFRPGDRPGIVLDALVVVVVAPIVEEALFRGILFQRWSRKWGVRTGALLSSTCFAILHIGVLGTFLLALVLCAVYVRTRSLWIPIAIHAANNAVVTLVMAPGAWVGHVEEAATLQEFRESWWMAAAGLAVGVPLLWWFARRYWPAEWRLPYEAESTVPERQEVGDERS